jgi:RNA polymerase sigma factor for flagellar operon FliA
LPALTDMLWARYQSARDEGTRHELLDQYIGLVYHAAREIERSAPRHLEFEELVSAGTLGLVQALESFDPGRGHAFSTFAVPRIRGAILDELRSWEWVPRSVRDRARLLANKQAELRAKLGREPLLDEVASALGVDLATYRIWMEEVVSPVILPLDQDVPGSRSGQVKLGETIADPSAVGPLETIETDRETALLRQAIALLPKKDQTVLALFYYEGLTQRQVAQVLHVTESRISQIRTRALRRLRERMDAVTEVGK